MEKTLPVKARVVIVGGGVLGCSVAYHLARNGWTDVVLLERKQLTSGTTWHAAGLVGQVQGTRSMTAFAKYSADLFAELERDTGQSTSFRKTGSLAVALHHDRLRELRRKADYAQSLGVDAREVGLDEIRERWPLLNVDGVVGGTYQPNDGWGSPTDITMALARGARMHGASIFENVAVERAIVEGGRVTGAITDHGMISADYFVNCTGMWAASLGRRNGVDVPNHACEHYYLVSDVIPDLPRNLPVLRVYDERTYYKEDAGKILFGFMHGEAKPWGMGGIPDDFSFTSLPFTEQDVANEIEMAVNRIPALSSIGIRTFFNGPESFTADGRFILGEAPNVAGYFILAGMNSTGIQTGGGAGRAVAQWIMNGVPPFDLAEMDPGRLEAFQSRDPYLQERAPETLVRTYAMRWPNYQRSTARHLRQTPLHADMRELGAFFGETLGWERPQWFAPSGMKPERSYGYDRENWFEYTAAEHRAVREGVGLIDMSTLGKLRIKGPDAASVIQRICSAETDVEPGKVFYSLWLNERGGIESDVTVARLGEQEYVVMGSTGNLPRDRSWLRKNIPSGANVAIRDETTSFGAVAIAGPLSRQVLARCADTDFSNVAFPHGTSQEFYLGHAPVRAQRISYAGELGWEIFFTPDFGSYVLRTLLATGAEFDMRPVGVEALESLRLEKGYRHWGTDVSYTDSPHEVGLSFACRADDRPAYIGRDAYIERRARPGRLRLCSLLLGDPKPLLIHDEPILKDGRMVGWVTSGGYGHTLGGAVGLGTVELPDGVSAASALASGGYAVRIEGRDIPATLSLRGFYDPNGERLHLETFTHGNSDGSRGRSSKCSDQ